MKKYMTEGGEEFTAASAADLVAQMQTTSFAIKAETSAQYMRGVAKRIKQMNSVCVDTTSPETFVAALLAIGFIKEQK